MRKSFKIILALLLVVLTLLPTQSNIAKAATTAYADGEYDLPFTVLQADKDEKSVADDYLDKPATLFVKNGEYTVQTTLKNDSWWQYFKTETTQGSFTDVEVLSENETEDTSVVQFKIEDIDEILNAKIHVIVPMINYDNKYDIRFSFDTSDIPLAPEPEPETEIEIIDIKDGDYTIGFDALHATEDKASAMARYIESPASLSVKNGKANLTLTINDHKTVTGFQVESNGKLIQETEKKIDEAANTREVTFELDNLASIVNAQVQYTVGAHNGDQPLRLSFDKTSLKEVVVEKPEEEPNEDPKEEPEEDVEKQPSEDPKTPTNDEDTNVDPKGEQKDQPSKPGSNNGEEDPKGEPKDEAINLDPANLKNGEYSIGYTVLKNNTEELSMMNDYVVSPASLKVDDGKLFVAITLLHSDWITDLQVEYNGELVQPKVLSADADADTRVVEFEVDDLLEKTNAQVKVDIPELNYHNTYDIQFAFDTDSIELLKAGEYPVKGKVEETKQSNIDQLKGTSGEEINQLKDTNGKDDGGLAFDRDEDTHNDKQDPTQKQDVQKMNNPKTADTTKIILFGLLLVGSLIPLAVKYRRRLI